MKKITLLLALLLMLSATACGSPEAKTPSEGDDSETTEVTTEEIVEPIPEADFDGKEIKFYIADDRTYMIAEKENGDTINDAVYARNRKVEEKYNCSFVFNGSQCDSYTWAEWYTTLEASILAGDNSVDIAAGFAYRFAALSVTSKLFHNIMDIPEVDLSQPWWPSNITEAACIGSKLFMIEGNVDPEFYSRIYAIVFNKALANDLSLDFYGMVDDGSWTFDKLREVAALGTRDLDGNSELDDNDQWGFATGYNLSIDAFNNAFDLEFVTTDSRGMPELLPLSEKVANACILMKEFTKNSDTVWYGLEEDKMPIFTAGHALLMPSNLKDIQTMRGLETDFGIIPYPKWDEQQETYISYSAGVDNSCGFSIPITADANINGTILEALAYYGYNDITPVYYETVLKTKSLRDNESAEMLDMIFNNIKFNFCMVYSYAFGDQMSPAMLMRMTLKVNKEIASTYQADKNLYEKTIAMLIESLE